eukprot:5544893-Amphidinium_carterae.1
MRPLLAEPRAVALEGTKAEVAVCKRVSEVCGCVCVCACECVNVREGATLLGPEDLHAVCRSGQRCAQARRRLHVLQGGQSLNNVDAGAGCRGPPSMLLDKEK